MRIDAITIFPEYLEPLRHALLGKAIEQGILEVGVHDLRDWATGNHKSVDAPPLGGGPGMVMKPEVWGPALDDAAAGRAGETLTTAAAHRNDKLRHDDVAAVAARPYDAADVQEGENPALPLLIVPTPAGSPFTQAQAQAWSREEHIVFACGRYEGIDQRVFEDASQRYRVREVSIGDYVLIGGEVAVLVIAEAVTRLIPGVLGNTESHEEDSFSDGLLEGPSYTKPRVWRGIEAPAVLTSGDHAKVAAWRREQSLKRTRAVRPDLLAQTELSEEDAFMLNARDVTTKLDVIVDPGRWNLNVEKRMRRALKKAGYVVASVALGEEGGDVCFEPPMLEQQYELEHGHPPLHTTRSLTVTGRTALPLAQATVAVAAALPEGTLWYGTTVVSPE
ncbi:tRNA (guanosine(37)-N1)-methyltransferase TrmD [Corynebacterium aquatimens]|uniref:tRNA (guanosine(37)-N1)-methyltransferase TrmD n=1 Tax=Corynebacterium aquatimens TaxID=1190508 RepID=UPI002540BCBD|nr:tRNA (guanosine(37)-N1)-methyltransferase TrmD [Corynebacterium aquatimens]QYH19541.1 tRNA (guanosine(37)-N1)-methyltransferase TrmD [Corynebacterium aquatimens]